MRREIKKKSEEKYNEQTGVFFKFFISFHFSCSKSERETKTKECTCAAVSPVDWATDACRLFRHSLCYIFDQVHIRSKSSPSAAASLRREARFRFGTASFHEKGDDGRPACN